MAGDDEIGRRRRPRPLQRTIRGGKRTRIRIPQPPDRDYRLNQRDLVRRELLREDPSWWTLHRRTPGSKEYVGDPLEDRAVSKEQVNGTLPERILYRALQRVVHQSAVSDFDFQSSLEGGRLELGGIVADFLFRNKRMVIRAQGPTHTLFLRMRKDDEQKGILESMGYFVKDIEDDMIYNEFTLEDWLRRCWNLGRGRGGASGAFGSDLEEDEQIGIDQSMLEQISMKLAEIELKIEAYNDQSLILLGRRAP